MENEVQKKDSKVITVVIVVTLLICIIGGIVAAIIFGEVNKKNKTNTTTTKAIEEVKEVKSIEDYTKKIKNKVEDGNLGIVLIDNSLTELDLKIEANCTADNKQVQFGVGKHVISYICTADDGGYNVQGKIDDIYSIKDSTLFTTGEYKYYINENGLILLGVGGGGAASFIVMYNNKGEQVVNDRIAGFNIPNEGNKYSFNVQGDYVSIAPFVENNEFYVVEPKVQSDKSKTCAIYKYDLKDYSKPVVTISEFQCDYELIY